MTTQRQHHTRRVTVGRREIITKGLRNGLLGDFYHRTMVVGWPVFLAGILAAFLLINLVFAVLFSLDPAGVANAPPGSFWHRLYFSIETLGTVGYGDMHPESHYAHVVASIEIFLGLIFAAVITGLIFQRFSRPRARMLFVRQPTISKYHGVPTLMIRIANVRLNAITNARAKLWFLRREVSEEGREYRRFRELPLLQQESPAFVLSWSIFHPIDAGSPMQGLTPADLAATDATFILAITGTDETSSQEVRARHYYGHEDILWGHRFVDIFESGETGEVVMNYFRFHDVEPE